MEMTAYIAAVARAGWRPLLCLSGLVLPSTQALSLQAPSSIVETEAPDLKLILQRMEATQREDVARSRPYNVVREYKIFRSNDQRPIAGVTAEIDFSPPSMSTYRIVQTRGNSWGEKMVRDLLDRETEAVKRVPGSEINRANYNFEFLRRENFGIIPEYILQIIPKRNDKYLLLGQIWVDTGTFRIRRIEGAPAKSPSFWLREVHITVQFAQLGDMWIPVTFDATARVRLLGLFSLAGVTVRTSASQPTARE